MKLPYAFSLLFTLFAFGFNDSVAEQFLEIDKKTGHYKSLSYDAITDQGLSWQDRAKLFGGETVYYENLNNEQRTEKENELKELLRRISVAELMLTGKPEHNLTSRVESAVRLWLDKQIEIIPESYEGGNAGELRNAAVGFFRAFEILGDKKYLDAGLICADRILEKQLSRGHWSYGDQGGKMMRVQDGFVTRPFWIMLYAHKLTKEKKYFESAKRAADVLLSAQSDAGGWPDQWIFPSGSTPSSGVRNGSISFNDGATNASFQIMVMMYHLTKDRKYVAKLGKLGPWLAKANLGEGNVVGWGQQYHGDGRPTRARQYEIELPYTRVTAWHVGPLLTWLYMMSGEESHIDLLKGAYATLERIRLRDLEPQNMADWDAIHEVWMDAPSYPRLKYRPGLPDAFFPDGSNWGCVQINYKMIPYWPVTPEQRRKYGQFMHSHRPGVSEMAKLARSYQIPPGRNNVYLYSHTSSKVVNALLGVRRSLLEYKRGGRKAMLKYHSYPTKFTADQYLQSRIDAAKRVLDYGRRSLAVDWGDRPFSNGISGWKNFGWVGRKETWYARNGAFQTSGPWSGTVWYQWQLIYDKKLALGEIDANASARGGRGLANAANYLDSWDVLGSWRMACHEIENHFDVPIK